MDKKAPRVKRSVHTHTNNSYKTHNPALGLYLPYSSNVHADGSISPIYLASVTVRVYSNILRQVFCENVPYGKGFLSARLWYTVETGGERL